MKNRFEGKTALITGGASGIGKSIAAWICDRGGKVFIADLNRDLLEETSADLSRNGSFCNACHLDVTDKNQLSKWIKACAEETGRIAGGEKLNPFYKSSNLLRRARLLSFPG